MARKYKNIFILGAGRNGSMSFANACKSINNYSSGHESRIAMSTEQKIQYPDFHIESDNRLSWILGALGERFTSEVLFVHLLRDESKVASSYNRRWHISNGIMPAYAQGILNIRMADNDISVCRDYVRTVNANITEFLRHRPSLTISIDKFEKDFWEFWKIIGAEGDFLTAVQSFHEEANSGQSAARLRKGSYLFRKSFDTVKYALSPFSDK